MSTSATVELTGGGLRVGVDALGARIGSIEHLATGTELLLRTAWADEELESFHRMSSSVQEWHRRYLGGWHTLLPNAGDARVVDGVEHPFHGEAGWRSWRLTEVTDSRCTAQVQLRTVPLEVTREVALDATGLRVAQSVRNLSTRAVSVSWTEHPAFGEAMLGERTTLEVGGRDIPLGIPGDDTPHGAFTEVADDTVGSYTLRNPDAGLAVTLDYDAAVFPVTWVWQEHHATRGYPWWGTANTMGVEPSSRRYQLADGELGPLTVAAGDTLATALTLTVTEL